MFVHSHRLDFADTRALMPEALYAADPVEAIAHADAADRALLRMVVYASVATLVLALALALASTLAGNALSF